MFTGIIETTGVLTHIQKNGTNQTFWISSSLAQELRIDQSLAHNGVCLTIEEIKGELHKVTAIEETLLKTNLCNWQIGDFINLERCMLMNGRLDGHIVQGHVDATTPCIEVVDKNGSWEFQFKIPQSFAHLVIEKGSVCINGISLTCFNVTNETFSVAIIPYTWQHTNMKHLQTNNHVNLEFDIIGKYITRMQSLNHNG